jgi:large subunit ribosomal protein L15
MLQLHTIKPALGARKRTKRVGRGNASGHGTTATRGTKGQRSRTGGRKGLKRLGFKLILQRIPKKRGFVSFYSKPAIVHLGVLDKSFADGAQITLQGLKALGLIPRKAKSAKILVKGGINKKFEVIGLEASKPARLAIEKTGGKVRL